MNPLVLCVDDDPELLAAVARTLRRDGHQVAVAQSAREALTVLESRQVAVMVCDHDMPEMTGVELAVRARDVQPETVRIMLTGCTTVDTAMAGINLGEVFRFLAKPFDPAGLRLEVAAAIAHHQEAAEVSGERLTVMRRHRLLEELEADFPGITAIPRDDAGTYLLDGEARQRVEAAAVSPFLALFDG